MTVTTLRKNRLIKLYKTICILLKGELHNLMKLTKILIALLYNPWKLSVAEKPNKLNENEHVIRKHQTSKHQTQKESLCFVLQLNDEQTF
jgi:hypothetical protein